MGQDPEIPRRRLLALCEYPVPTEGNPDPEEECGELAIAIWEWPDDSQMFVCAEHDKIVTKQEKETGDYWDGGTFETYIKRR